MQVSDPYSQTLNSLHQTAQAAAAAHHYNQLTAAAVSQRTTHDVLRRDGDSLHVVSFDHNIFAMKKKME